MTGDKVFEYARDDFNYPRFAQNLLKKVLNFTISKVQDSDLDADALGKIRFGLEGLAILALLFGAYFLTAILVAVWLFVDQLHLHLFVDRSVASNRFKHFVEETPLLLALSLHMWIEGQ